MTTENTTATTAEITAAPVVDTRPPPKSDAEAAQREAEDAAAKGEKEPAKAGKAAEAAATGEGTEQAEGENANGKPDDGKKQNRTTVYINRLQEENRKLREAIASGQQPSQDARTPPQQKPAGTASTTTSSGAEAANPEPTLEQHDYDIEAYTRAHSQWAVQEAKRQDVAQAQADSQRQSQQQMLTSYNERAAAFEADHPDFKEAIGGMPYELSDQVGIAILGHERGPEIAYFVANNDDEAFTLANTLPQNAAAAVARLVSRMDAAQQASQQAAADTTAQGAATPAAKPISKAPAPTPTVGGRSTVNVPPEKQTDDDWYKADRERRRKR